MPSEAKDLILLVEDSPEDYEATARVLRQSGVTGTMLRCADGDEALDYLHLRGPQVAATGGQRPCIILLDLNLPGTDGREVLRDIKTDDSLRQIPVIVLTTSTDERDIANCYRIGANSYIKKPVNLEALADALQALIHYWFHIVLLPKVT
jgi:CheY-like chemotaxis protein